MDCDHCGRTIEEGPLVSVGSRKRAENLCRACWTKETQNSNSRLISALNELSRADGKQKARERRTDPSRPQWHS